MVFSDRMDFLIGEPEKDQLGLGGDVESKKKSTSPSRGF